MRGAAVAARLARLARLSCGAEVEAKRVREYAVSGRAKEGEAKGERLASSEGSTPKRSVSSAIVTCLGSGLGLGLGSGAVVVGSGSGSESGSVLWGWGLGRGRVGAGLG